MRPINAEQFLKDVVNHKLTIKADNELYRHLYFRQPGNSNMWFELVTWPGGLTIHGDMGTWSFSRVPDMFTFFRETELKINASYWTEKIDAESRFGGPSQTFVPEVYKANVLSHLDGYGFRFGKKSKIIAELDTEVFNEEDETTARRAFAEFEHGGFTFSDPWEINGQGYTYHYLWCLHAIVWGIQQYDATLKTWPIPSEIL